jgi:hypothetical protein
LPSQEIDEDVLEKTMHVIGAELEYEKKMYLKINHEGRELAPRRYVCFHHWNALWDVDFSGEPAEVFWAMRRRNAFQVGFDDGYNGCYINPFDKIQYPALWTAYDAGNDEGLRRLITEETTPLDEQVRLSQQQ